MARLVVKSHQLVGAECERRVGLTGVVAELNLEHVGRKGLNDGADLSLSPPSVRPTTGAAHDLEHFLIFLATGMTFGFDYSRRAGLLTIALPIFAAAIELAQRWVPGRHARMSDFLVDAASSCVGVALSYAFLKLRAAAIRR